jgi:hypothetical protein
METISVAEYRHAKQIVKLFKQTKKHMKFIKSLPVLEENMVLEYRDLAGYWYEYTKDLQDNIHFCPDKLRVRIR